MCDTILAITILIGYEGEDWVLPEYNRYYWIGYGLENRN
ncbi:hypothetical protein ES703_98791 [subsurface metagenome]